MNCSPRQQGVSQVTLFDDQVSNFTRIADVSRWSPSAGTYFEGNNFYVYIRGTDDPQGAWWNSPDSPEVQDAAGVLVNSHFDSYVPGLLL